MVPESCGHRYPVEKNGRQNAVDKENHDDNRYRYYQRLADEKACYFSTYDILYPGPEEKNQYRCKSGGQNGVNGRFGGHHSDGVSRSAPEAFPEGHLPASVYGGRYHYEQIVEYGDEEQGGGHQRQNQSLLFLVHIRVVPFCDGSRRVFDIPSCSPHLLHREMGILETVNIISD